jgi:dTDP-glucose 4,6-dehydratase/UDP-glucuronate decarboxylase
MSGVGRIIQEDAEVMKAAIPGVFSRLAGSNILVTGASGFLGSYIVDILSVLNHASPGLDAHIVASDNFIATNADRLAHLKGDPFVELRTANVVDETDWGRRFDWIIHCASMASPIFYRPRPLETIDANVNGTWRMLELAEAHGAKGMLFFSSSEIYGDPDPRFIPTPEHYRGYVSCTGPRACYDESKRLGETLCISFWAQRKVPAKIVRPFNVYGPGQRLNDGRMVPDMMSAALDGGPIVLLSDGSPTRSFCYVRDFIAGSLAVLVLGEPAEPYNVGNSEERSMLEVARLMAELAGRRGRPLEVQFRKSGDAQYLVDNPSRRCPDLTKVRTHVGYQPSVDLRTGLARTFEFYRASRRETVAA